MGSCQCVPPARLHVLPLGVHLPDGGVSSIILVEDAWADDGPLCSVCAGSITTTFYRCAPCDAVICRTCLALDTEVVECDCDGEVALTGVQLAARRAAAARAR